MNMKSSSKRTSKSLEEVVDINGSKVFVENGQVRTILNENIRRTGYMSVEDSRRITLEAVKKIYELNDNV